MSFEEIVQRIDRKISGWKAKLLSQAGRSMLINAVASPILMYEMSSILLPKTSCFKIDKLF